MKITNNFDALEFIKTHLLNQGQRSMAPDTTCKYFVDNGDLEHPLQCAVGALIDAELYSEDLEGVPADSHIIIDVVRRSNPLWHVDSNSIRMLKNAQMVHDCLQPNQWEKFFEKTSLAEFCRSTEQAFVDVINNFIMYENKQLGDYI